MNFMSAMTGSPAGTVQFMVKTFRMLCSLADFDDNIIEGHLEPAPNETTRAPRAIAASSLASAQNTKDEAAMLVTGIQIHLHLPVSDDVNVYNAIFKSFAIHILRREDNKAENQIDATDDAADHGEANA